MTIEVTVKDNNVEQALRSLKKKMQREGLYKEMKLRKHYEKPSLRKAREKEESIRRVRKQKTDVITISISQELLQYFHTFFLHHQKALLYCLYKKVHYQLQNILLPTIF